MTHLRKSVQRGASPVNGRRRLFKLAAVGGATTAAGLASAGSASAATASRTGDAEFLDVTVDNTLTVNGDTALTGGLRVQGTGVAPGTALFEVALGALTVHDVRLPSRGVGTGDASAGIYLDATGTSVFGPVTFSDATEDYPLGVSDGLKVWGTTPHSAVVATQRAGFTNASVPIHGGAAVTASSPDTAIAATQTDSTSIAPAMAVTGSGLGPALKVTSTHQRSGSAAVMGSSTNGYGAQLQGGRAPLNLAPGTAMRHPERGMIGDLYVTARGDLWFCKGGTTWKKIA